MQNLLSQFLRCWANFAIYNLRGNAVQGYSPCSENGMSVMDTHPHNHVKLNLCKVNVPSQDSKVWSNVVLFVRCALFCRNMLKLGELLGSFLFENACFILSLLATFWRNSYIESFASCFPTILKNLNIHAILKDAFWRVKIGKMGM